MFKKGLAESEKELEQSKEHIAELERKVSQPTYDVDWFEKIYRNHRTRMKEKTSLIFRSPRLRLADKLSCKMSTEAVSTASLPRRRLFPTRIYFSCAKSMILQMDHPPWGYNNDPHCQDKKGNF